jgi:inorganic pyrophosphatase
MANLYKDISCGDNSPDEINVIIEVPKNSSNKYEYNEEKGNFELDRIIHSPLFFPFEYGFIPQTLSEDGDPLDIVLLSTYPTFPGCLVKAKPIGVLMMEDEKGIDHKIIAVPLEKLDPHFKEVKDIEDINQHLKKEIEVFFQDYKNLEKDKFVKIMGWGKVDKAKEIIKKSSEKYEG